MPGSLEALHPQTKSTLQELQLRKAPGAVMNALLEKHTARKGLWTPEKLLEVPKKQHLRQSPPRGPCRDSTLLPSRSECKMEFTLRVEE